MTSHTEIARAKVNLVLRVLGRRADGYHELVSLVAFADLGDEVTIDLDRPAGVSTQGPYATEIDGPNLIAKALELLAHAQPRLRLGHVALTKHLPVAAGLGGGSADAAAVLRAVRAQNPELCDSVDWSGIARQLGADVSVCLAQRTSVMRGTGERIARCEIPPLPALLVNPRVPVPADKTRAVFRALAAGRVEVSRDLEIPARLAEAALLELMQRLGNDLEAPATRVMPAIAEVTSALRGQAGYLCAQLSGAGPTCFAVFANTEAARSAGTALASAHPGWWIAATTLGVTA